MATLAECAIDQYQVSIELDANDHANSKALICFTCKPETAIDEADLEDAFELNVDKLPDSLVIEDIDEIVIKPTSPTTTKAAARAETAPYAVLLEGNNWMYLLFGLLISCCCCGVLCIMVFRRMRRRKKKKLSMSTNADIQLTNNRINSTTADASDVAGSKAVPNVGEIVQEEDMRQQLMTWLDSVNMVLYYDAFVEHGYHTDMDKLKFLTHEKLKQMGVWNMEKRNVCLRKAVAGIGGSTRSRRSGCCRRPWQSKVSIGRAG